MNALRETLNVPSVAAVGSSALLGHGLWTDAELQQNPTLARKLEALQLRQSGMKLALIGTALGGVSRERARSMVIQAKLAVSRRKAWLSVLKCAVRPNRGAQR